MLSTPFSPVPFKKHYPPVSIDAPNTAATATLVCRQALLDLSLTYPQIKRDPAYRAAQQDAQDFVDEADLKARAQEELSKVQSHLPNIARALQRCIKEDEDTAQPAAIANDKAQRILAQYTNPQQTKILDKLLKAGPPFFCKKELKNIFFHNLNVLSADLTLIHNLKETYNQRKSHSEHQAGEDILYATVLNLLVTNIYRESLVDVEQSAAEVWPKKVKKSSWRPGWGLTE